MIKIYTDKNYLNGKYRKKIFPLLFELYFLKNANLSKLFVFDDDMEECDIVIVPVNIIYLIKENQQEYLKQFIFTAKQKNKIIWAYSGGDIGKTIDESVYVFRFGGFDTKMGGRTIILPSFISDPYERFLKKEFKVLEKEALPAIGFVGNANGSITSLAREMTVFLYLQLERLTKNFYFDYQSFYPSGYKRYQLLKKIENDKRIESNFIYREKHTTEALTEGEIKKSTMEFYENMEQNPYVFCLRGLGNFSIRFYETILMGRIPVVVDTDMRLPFPEKINWEKHCVFVKEESMTSQLVAFHNKISNDDFKKMQVNNRNLAMNVLSSEGYFIELYKIFKNK